MTELLRFAVVRPANSLSHGTVILLPNLAGKTVSSALQIIRNDYSMKGIENTVSNLKNLKIISKLDNLLSRGEDATYLLKEIDTNTESWKNDIQSMDKAIVSIYANGQDLGGLLPLLCRYRQLYDFAEFHHLRPLSLPFSMHSPSDVRHIDSLFDTIPINVQPLPHPAIPIVKFAGIYDLVVVKERMLRYDKMEVGNIHNIMKTERMVRETKKLDRTENTIFTKQESNTEDQRDSQTTERYSLSREVNNVIKQDKGIKGNLSLSGSYGPTVSFAANAEASMHNSSDTSTKLATSYAKEVTSKASKKVIENFMSSQTAKTISEFQENFKHEFDNTKSNANDISGVYQWVNKVTQSQMYNYGKRAIFDVVVPEPAAFIKSIGKAPEPDALIKPDTIFETISAINIREKTHSTSIDSSNYMEIATKYNVEGIAAPPSPEVTIGKSFFKANTDEKGEAVDVAIPLGYQSAYINSNMTFTHRDHNDTDTLKLFVGSLSFDLLQPLPLSDFNMGGIPFYTVDSYADNMPISIVSMGVYQYAGNVSILCKLTTEALQAWETKTSDAIYAAYSALLSSYNDANAQQQQEDNDARQGQNPDTNKDTIKTELKKWCISLLTQQSFDSFNAALKYGPETPGKPNIIGGPNIDFSIAAQQGPYVKFFEQAFEWENMQYVLYPYYWTNKANWAHMFQAQPDPDPGFEQFLKSGAARVVFPVRLGFFKDVMYFMLTGTLWAGGQLPAIGTGLSVDDDFWKIEKTKSDYLPIAEEIQASEDLQGNEIAIGTPWEVSVPTSLVRLRGDGELPVWQDSNGEWVSN